MPAGRLRIRCQVNITFSSTPNWQPPWREDCRYILLSHSQSETSIPLYIHIPVGPCHSQPIVPLSCISPHSHRGLACETSLVRTHRRGPTISSLLWRIRATKSITTERNPCRGRHPRHRPPRRPHERPCLSQRSRGCHTASTSTAKRQATLTVKRLKVFPCPRFD